MGFSKRQHSTLLTAGVFVCAGSLIAYGAWGLIARYRATHAERPVIPAKVTSHTTAQPDETPPVQACAEYEVAPNEPRQIALPALDATGCVQKVGIDQQGAIAAPTNVHLAGWYIHSAVPGEQGVSIIDGHVRGRYADGIFIKLGQLRPGDALRVQLGDMSWRDFTVMRNDTYPAAQAAEELPRQLEGTVKQLTLITCGGSYDQRTKTYDKRVIVRAALAQ